MVYLGLGRWESVFYYFPTSGESVNFIYKKDQIYNYELVNNSIEDLNSLDRLGRNSVLVYYKMPNGEKSNYLVFSCGTKYHDYLLEFDEYFMTIENYREFKINQVVNE